MKAYGRYLKKLRICQEQGFDTKYASEEYGHTIVDTLVDSVPIPSDCGGIVINSVKTLKEIRDANVKT